MGIHTTLKTNERFITLPVDLSELEINFDDEGDVCKEANIVLAWCKQCLQYPFDIEWDEKFAHLGLVNVGLSKRSDATLFRLKWG